jgi:diacylglycerol kinase (ATP)
MFASAIETDMRRSFALVYNARAGIALPRRLDGVVGHLREYGSEVFQLAARTAAEATDRVAEAAARGICDAVIAAGGDGTFRAVAAGAAGTLLPVGLIPLGTGNVLAHEVAMGKNVRTIANVLVRGPVIGAQAGLVNGAPFFLMVGAGFDARVVAGLDYASKRAFGRAAYMMPVLRTLRRGPERFDVSVDGEAYQASWVIVTRASHFGGSFKLTRDTCVGVDHLIAVVIDARTRLELIVAALALPLGRLLDPATRPSFVRTMTARKVEIGRLSGAAVEVDGDVAGSTPVVISSEGPIVRLIVPERYVADVTNLHANHVHSKL